MEDAKPIKYTAAKIEAIEYLRGFSPSKMQQLYYEDAFLTQLHVYTHMFGVKWVVNLCHTFIINSLHDQEQRQTKPIVRPLSPRPSPVDCKIETDSLSEELPSFVPIVEEASSSILSPPSTPVPVSVPVPEPVPEPEAEVKILRLKKSSLLQSPTPCTPQAKHSLTETVKKTTSPKKRSPVRDLGKLVKSGNLPPGTKVVPSAPEIKPDIYGIIQVNSSGKVGIQPSWNTDTLYVGKSNAPTQFLAAVNKQFPSHKVYGRENAWNDLLKVNPAGGYVSLADLWLQSR